MLDDLLELFERDQHSTSKSKTGWRGRLSSLLGDDRRERHSSSERTRDDEDDDHRSSRSRTRDRELFEFGD
jgi:hypothetical protein